MSCHSNRPLFVPVNHISTACNIPLHTTGHLGASLGVVELTVAMHYVFNTPDDKVRSILPVKAMLKPQRSLQIGQSIISLLGNLSRAGGLMWGCWLCRLCGTWAIRPMGTRF